MRLSSVKAPAISEKDFEAQVKDLAKIFQWKYYHTWRSFHSPAGFPDCVMVRPRRTIFAELKSEKGIVSPKQQEWLDILAQCPGNEVFVWRPGDFEGIVEILK